MSDSMSLAEIAEASGIPARTVRFYIARGILDGPVKGGRSAAYTRGHLERLERIKNLQAEGRTLADIGRILEAPSAESAAAPAPVAWWQHAIDGDVMVWVRADASPWRMKQVRAAVEDFARRLKRSE